MRLQYQMSNGVWVDCDERTPQFLALCVAQAGGDESAVLAKLAAGGTVRNDRDDWYSNCRDGEIADARLAAARAAQQPQPRGLRCRRCGATGRAGDYPFSTLAGNVCDDCI